MVVNLKLIIQRLKDEHRALRMELDYVHEKTSQMASLHGTDESNDVFREIRRRMTSFMLQLEEHEHWEEIEVLPILARYANQGTEPSFIISKWVMEEDHKKVERFVQAFIEYADQCIEADSMKLKKAISLLHVACSVLSEHLLLEEEMFFPIADQMINERQSI